MIAIAHFLGLVLTTLFAATAAVVLDWIFLGAMFQLMRPATARATRTSPAGTQAKGYAFGSELVQGTRTLARQFGAAAVRR